jgi:hypothetical protein
MHNQEDAMGHAQAIDSFYDDFIPLTFKPRIDWRIVAALAGVTLLWTLIAVGSPPAMEAYRDYQAAREVAEAAKAVSTTTQLPLEWRWEPKGVKYDHMFMNRR